MALFSIYTLFYRLRGRNLFSIRIRPIRHSAFGSFFEHSSLRICRACCGFCSCPYPNSFSQTSFNRSGLVDFSTQMIFYYTFLFWGQCFLRATSMKPKSLPVNQGQCTTSLTSLAYSSFIIFQLAYTYTRFANMVFERGFQAEDAQLKQPPPEEQSFKSILICPTTSQLFLSRFSRLLVILKGMEPLFSRLSSVLTNLLCRSTKQLPSQKQGLFLAFKKNSFQLLFNSVLNFLSRSKIFFSSTSLSLLSASLSRSAFFRSIISSSCLFSSVTTKFIIKMGCAVNQTSREPELKQQTQTKKKTESSPPKIQPPKKQQKEELDPDIQELHL